MPESALARKLKLRAGQRATLVNAPAGYDKELRPLPDDVELASTLKGDFDWVQVFVKNQAEAEKLVPRAAKALRPSSALWVSFPKGTSGTMYGNKAIDKDTHERLKTLIMMHEEREEETEAVLMKIWQE